MLSFEPLPIPDLRDRWLEHYEHVLRSSVHTVARYRTATQHLLNFLRAQRPVQLASLFTARDAVMQRQPGQGHVVALRRHRVRLDAVGEVAGHLLSDLQQPVADDAQRQVDRRQALLSVDQLVWSGATG